MTKGDRVKLVDGMGGYHEGIITGSDPSACKIRITDSYQGFGKREYRLHMAVSPIKTRNDSSGSSKKAWNWELTR